MQRIMHGMIHGPGLIYGGYRKAIMDSLNGKGHPLCEKDEEEFFRSGK
jgi:hypothetical protein